MRLSTVLNHQQRLSDRLHSLYSSARFSHPSHTELLQQIKENVWNDPAFRKLPGWCRSVLLDRQRTLSQSLWHDALIWAFPPSDGGAPLQLDSLSESDRQAVFNGEIKGSHYWTRSNKQRTVSGSTITITNTLTITHRAFIADRSAL